MLLLPLPLPLLLLVLLPLLPPLPPLLPPLPLLLLVIGARRDPLPWRRCCSRAHRPEDTPPPQWVRNGPCRKHRL